MKMKNGFQVVISFSLAFLISCGGDTVETEEAENLQILDELSEFEENYDDGNDYSTTVEDKIDSSQYEETLIFLDLVLERDYKAISKMIDYPLDRFGSIPHIMNEDEFVERAPDIIDSRLLDEIREFKKNPEIFDYTGSNGTYWTEDYNFLFWGNGMLKGITYTSVKEAAMAKSLKKEIQGLMYQPMDDYYENLYFGETSKFIFRIDYLNENDSQLRYASWSKSKGLNEEPDLVCYDGFTEKMGTGGGFQTSFVRGDYTYMLDQVEMCGDEENCGDYLTVFELGAIISNERCFELMDELSYVKAHLTE